MTINDVPAISDDQIKLIFEHTKHLTTLSAGATVTIVTFYDKLGAARHWKVVVAASLICFVSSIIAGIYAQIRTIDEFGAKIVVDNVDTRWAFLTSWIAFVLGMLALCVYGIRNF